MAKQFRLQLRTVAQARGFPTADALARASNVKFATVSRYWYSDVKEPSAPILILLARTLGTTVEDLFVEEERSESPRDRRVTTEDPSSQTDH